MREERAAKGREDDISSGQALHPCRVVVELLLPVTICYTVPYCDVLFAHFGKRNATNLYLTLNPEINSKANLEPTY